jgi:hypothetical protein
MLVARDAHVEAKEPTRLLELHLTGNMERYMWSFDGRMYSAISDVPIRFAWNERVRVKLINNTMMAHPIHLHGMYFEMVNGQPTALQPRKNTMIVQPGASAQFDLTAGPRVFGGAQLEVGQEGFPAVHVTLPSVGAHGDTGLVGLGHRLQEGGDGQISLLGEDGDKLPEFPRGTRRVAP